MVLLTGGRGCLAGAFLDFFKAKEIPVTSLYWESFDIERLHRFLSEGRHVDYFINCAAISNRDYSREHPYKTFNTNAYGVVKHLQMIQNFSPTTKYLGFGSVYEFDEDNSPYTCSKRMARQAIQSYRAAGLWCAMPRLGLTEYYGRAPEFLSKKIIKKAVEISRAIRTGVSFEPLILKDIDDEFRWAWAPDVVEACWDLMQGAAEDPILEGPSHKLSKFVELAFVAAGCGEVNWISFDGNDYRLVTKNTVLVKSTISATMVSRIIKADIPITIDYINESLLEELEKSIWRPKTSLSDMIKLLIQHEQVIGK